MFENSKVFWSEGIFLLPQHFQQHDRYIQNLVSSRYIDEPHFRASDLEGSNPLIGCSFTLLSLVTKLRNLLQHNAISELQQRLVGEIKSFENRTLQKGASRIVVIGHTDNQKIKFSARFKSNWHLSRARAENAANILNKNGALGNRMRFEGMADKNPIAPNDTKKNRALNRRIDIHIR